MAEFLIYALLYKVYLICFAGGTVLGLTTGFALGKKDISFERGISLIMFAIWILAFIIYGATGGNIPSTLNIAGFGAITGMMGVEAGRSIRDAIKSYFEVRLGK